MFFEMHLLTWILKRRQCRKATVVAVISDAALDVVRSGGVTFLRAVTIHQVLIAVQRKLLVCRRTTPRNALVAELITDSRLPALDCILAEVGMCRSVGTVGWLAAVALVSAETSG